MTVTDIGLSGTALAIGSFSPNRPQYLRIGSGSGTELSTATGLFAEISDPKTFTAVDNSTPKIVTFQADWSAPTMSGLELREFALTTGSADNEVWSYENLGNAISFDGTNELRIDLEWTVY